MDKSRKGRIEWFIRFININFQESSLDEKISLVQDMQNIFGMCLHPELSSLLDSSWEPEMAEAEFVDKEKALRRLQNKLGGFFDELMKKFREAQRYDGTAGNFLDSVVTSDILKLRLLDTIDIGGSVKIMIRNKPTVERHPKGRKQWRAYWPKKTLECLRLELVIAPEENDKGFIFFFAQALDNISLSSLRTCDDCSKWLLQSGKRKRLYCSDQCRVRRANRARRKVIKEEGGHAYEKERSKGAKRARGSYVKKKKKELGPNVKVGKRKTKRKSS